ncbi:MAG: hypothetical protein GX900_07905 [Clostridiaceae bacterium]|nr:hypothetical protein [Clostridiaceae bacterium]
MSKNIVKNRYGFICFGEINTPVDRLNMKHDEGLAQIQELGFECVDAGLVIDDPPYETADAAIARLKEASDLCAIVVCVAGWIPTHAVIRVCDHFRHLPMLLWGLCGWKDNGRLITTAEQAGTTAMRRVFEEMGYKFKYITDQTDRERDVAGIADFLTAAATAKTLRSSRVGSFGYRDMILYNTQYEAVSLRRDIGVEVEHMELLQLYQRAQEVTQAEIDERRAYIMENWTIHGEYDPAILERACRYAAALSALADERKFDALTLNDVDGMKRLLNYPPALTFMLVSALDGIQVIPENDVLGNVTQLMLSYLSGGQISPYVEFYEFMNDYVLAGVPDFIPPAVSQAVELEQKAFGLLDKSLLNVSKLRLGRLTLGRLFADSGSYAFHLVTGEAKAPPAWGEYGWDDPIPQLPSTALHLDVPVKEFTDNVMSQHISFVYGDYANRVIDLAYLIDLPVLAHIG